MTAKISAAKKDRVVWTSIDLGEQSPITPANMSKVRDPAHDDDHSPSALIVRERK